MPGARGGGERLLVSLYLGCLKCQHLPALCDHQHLCSAPRSQQLSPQLCPARAQPRIRPETAQGPCTSPHFLFRAARPPWRFALQFQRHDSFQCQPLPPRFHHPTPLPGVSPSRTAGLTWPSGRKPEKLQLLPHAVPFPQGPES